MQERPSSGTRVAAHRFPSESRPNEPRARNRLLGGRKDGFLVLQNGRACRWSISTRILAAGLGADEQRPVGAASKSCRAALDHGRPIRRIGQPPARAHRLLPGHAALACLSQCFAGPRHYGRTRRHDPRLSGTIDAEFLRYIWNFEREHRPRVIQSRGAFRPSDHSNAPARSRPACMNSRSKARLRRRHEIFRASSGVGSTCLIRTYDPL